ncbi:signal-regulatory protein beta-2-like [Archocentrus centrarchus]|uniref:signal-regulatory protein beta-2-like n=1 Tax=Archocentrus centrarchus TaxID=63155 RepID=UPI0011E9CC2F|nr:signal-regulatory protein beta-2-like [Archocentrus centrarchus]
MDWLFLQVRLQHFTLRSQMDSPVVLLLMTLIYGSTALQQDVQVKLREDVTLQCQISTEETISVLKWSRADLSTDGYVYFYRNRRFYENYQHPSFHGRVKLRNPEMKDGDVSLILENVTFNDTGIYECHIAVRNSGSSNRAHTEISHFINLTVTALQQDVQVKLGEDVTLQCQISKHETISVLKWSRADLSTDGYVYFYRNRRSYQNYQHPSFHGRVKLRNPEMKDGDVSLILENVTFNDAGIYECHIAVRNSGSSSRAHTEISHFINLTVTGETHGNMMETNVTEGEREDENTLDVVEEETPTVLMVLPAVVVVVVVVVAAAAAAAAVAGSVVLWRFKRKKKQPTEAHTVTTSWSEMSRGCSRKHVQQTPSLKTDSEFSIPEQLIRFADTASSLLSQMDALEALLCLSLIAASVGE